MRMGVRNATGDSASQLAVERAWGAQIISIHPLILKNIPCHLWVLEHLLPRNKMDAFLPTGLQTSLRA